MTDKTVDIALLLDSHFIEEWQEKALKNLKYSKKVDIRINLLIIKKDNMRNSYCSKKNSFLSKVSNKGLFILYKKARKAAKPKPWYRRAKPISEIDFINDFDRLECRPMSTPDLGNKLPPHAVEKLTNVDIGIRFGFGILKGDALTAPNYGILSYHHGNLTEYRGKPAGFYEYMHNKPTASVTIQKLNESLDGGQVVLMNTIDISDAKSWNAVKSDLFHESTNMLAEAISRCIFKPEKITKPKELGDLYFTPTNKLVLSYLKKQLYRKIISK